MHSQPGSARPGSVLDPPNHSRRRVDGGATSWDERWVGRGRIGREVECACCGCGYVRLGAMNYSGWWVNRAPSPCLILSPRSVQWGGPDSVGGSLPWVASATSVMFLFLKGCSMACVGSTGEHHRLHDPRLASRGPPRPRNSLSVVQAERKAVRVEAGFR